VAVAGLRITAKLILRRSIASSHRLMQAITNAGYPREKRSIIVAG
jgi:hypothetical protein